MRDPGYTCVVVCCGPSIGVTRSIDTIKASSKYCQYRCVCMSVCVRERGSFTLTSRWIESQAKWYICLYRNGTIGNYCARQYQSRNIPGIHRGFQEWIWFSNFRPIYTSAFGPSGPNYMSTLVGYLTIMWRIGAGRRALWSYSDRVHISGWETRKARSSLT